VAARYWPKYKTDTFLPNSSLSSGIKTQTDMKKLIALSAFIVIGFTATFAQGPAQTKPAATKPAATASSSAATSVKPMENTAESITLTKPENKKECTTDEKKACNKGGKKSCCSKPSNQ
jgi:hypothetical protein